jgi:hypothetical protein
MESALHVPFILPQEERILSSEMQSLSGMYPVHCLIELECTQFMYPVHCLISEHYSWT